MLPLRRNSIDIELWEVQAKLIKTHNKCEKSGPVDPVDRENASIILDLMHHDLSDPKVQKMVFQFSDQLDHSMVQLSKQLDS